MPVLITEDDRVVIVTIFFLGILWFARKSPVALAIPFYMSNMFKTWFLKNVPAFEKYDYTVIVSILALVAAVGSVLRRPRFRVFIPWSLYLSFGGLLVVLYISTPLYYGWAMREYLKLLAFGAVAIVVPPFLIRTTEDLMVLWRTLLFAAVLVSLTSLFSPLSYGSWRGIFLSETDMIVVGRLCAFGMLIVAAMFPHFQRSKGLPARILTLLSVLIAVAGMVHSGSRGPLLHAIATLLVLLPARRDSFPGKTSAVLTASMAFLAVWFLFPADPGVERIAALGDPETVKRTPSLDYRFRAWDFVLDTWNRGLILGQGVGVCEFREGIQPHSLFLEILYSGGLLGALFFLTMVVLVAVSWARRPVFPGHDIVEWASLPAFILAVHGAIASTTAYSIASSRGVFFLFSTSMAAVSVMRQEAARRAADAAEPGATGPEKRGL